MKNETTSDPSRGVEATKRHEKYYFRDGNITLQVGNTIFRLHRHFFDRESKYFRDLLDSPTNADDDSADNRLTIRDVKCEEFAQLIWVWYNPCYSYSKQSKENWLTILRLATHWGFGDIRDLAIRQLEKFAMDPIEKITVYKQYEVDNALLLPSYMILCTNPSLPSSEEAAILKMDTVLRIASAREKIASRASELACQSPTIANAPKDIVEVVVAETFNLPLHSSDQAEEQSKNDSSTYPGNALDAEPVVPKQPNPEKTTKTESTQPQPFPARPVDGAGSKTRKGKKNQVASVETPWDHWSPTQ